MRYQKYFGKKKTNINLDVTKFEFKSNIIYNLNIHTVIYGKETLVNRKPLFLCGIICFGIICFDRLGYSNNQFYKEAA